MPSINTIGLPKNLDSNHGMWYVITVQNENTLTNKELNEVVKLIPLDDLIPEKPLPKPKKWIRVDCGQTEVYVGDRLYIIALVEKIPESIDEVTGTHVKLEDVVIKYLKAEGFIDNDYAYIGMQRFKMKGKNNEEDEGLV